MSDSATTNSGMPNFGSNTNKQAAINKQKNIKKNLEDNKQRSQQAKNKPSNPEKRSTTIAVGKELVDKFFRGFSELERANVRADLDDEITFRIAENYEDAILAYCTDNEEYQEEAEQQKLGSAFLGGISLATAIKLYRSSTESEKQKNHSFNCLDRTKVKVPQQAGIIIDSLGKTDITGDNHFRLNDQNYAARRHAIRGILYVLGDKIKDYIRDDRNLNLELKDLEDLLENEQTFINMIDDSTTSVERLKKIGRRIYTEASDHNINFTFNDKQYSMRLPKFDLPAELTMDDVGKILANSFFEDFKAQNEDIVKAMGGLLLMISKQSWLRNSSKKMVDLDSKFGGTIFADNTFNEIMKFCNVWNLNDFFKTEDINDLGIDAISKWNTGYFQIFKKFLNMKEMEFSDFGNEAQVIQIDQKGIDKNHKTEWGWNSFRMKGRVQCKSMFKNVSAHCALLGVMTGMTKNIEVKNDYNVDYDLQNRSILKEFLKKDFSN